jgi:3-oxoacyl-[acyl-carrier-protein] synthase-1
MRAMRGALALAGLDATDIDYINLHGTGTRSNDAAEDGAVHSVFGDGVPCSATKGWTGHTLGAAGAVEAVIALLCLKRQFIPGTVNSSRVDPKFRSQVRLKTSDLPVDRVLSNSFGFGGSNCSLIFGRPWT